MPTQRICNACDKLFDIIMFLKPSGKYRYTCNVCEKDKRREINKRYYNKKKRNVKNE